MIKPSDVADLNDEADGGDKGDAAQGLQNIDDRRPAPRRHQLPQLARQAIASALGLINRVAVLLERDVLRGTRERQARQPPAIWDRPSDATRIRTALPQQKHLQPVPGLRRDDDRIFTGAHEVPHRFIGRVGNVDRAQLAGAMAPGERHAIAPVGLHAVAAALGNHRRTDHDASPAGGWQVSMDPDAARAGLEHEVEDPVRRAQRAHRFVERLEVSRDGALVPNLALAAALGDRDVDRFLVDIQPYEHATVPHDRPPRVWRCAPLTRRSA